MDGNKTKTEFLAPFLLLLGLYCVWVLTLPLFPSLDGSLHLYYASVLGSLLSGSKVFSSYYFIRHVLPPYALHDYFLIAAAHFFGYVMADKLIVCLIFLVTACGFRYFSRQLGPSGGLLSLLAIPLLLNWTLGMGFYNYCLAIGMALWALGLWFRAVARRSHRLWVGFLGVVVLMVLTHPVPTFFVYILVGVDVGWRILSEVRGRRMAAPNNSVVWKRFRWDLFYMLAAWSTFFYMALFIRAHRVMGNIKQTYPRKAELAQLAKLSTLAMFSGSQATVLIYRLSLYLILALAIFLASRGLKTRWKNRKTTPADVLLVCSILLLIAIPILPPVLNGANYFAQRLMIIAWIGALAAAAGHFRMPRHLTRAFAIVACMYAVAVLFLASARIRPVAVRIYQIETAATTGGNYTGLTLGLPDAPDPSELNYVPYYWAASRYFRRTHSTLLNGGWLYESYVPLGSHVRSLDDQLTPSFQDAPGDVYRLLRSSAEARRRIMPRANLLLFTGKSIPTDLVLTVSAMDESEPARQWQCRSADWYSVCTAPFAK